MTAETVDRSRWAALAVLCLSLFVIVADTTIVNVALPTLVRRLGASDRQLEWIVDAYNLVFAALLLAAGSLGDRFGRRGLLALGLAVFGASSVAAALVSTPDQLIAARALMGVGAAMIFPATLGIISNVFRDPGERARAIGIWTAVSGAAVALGPLTGGLLLAHFRWGSVFLINVPIVIAALIAGRIWVPTSRDPAAPRLDMAGLALSIAGVGLLVYTIIEAPDRGWLDAVTIAGLAASALLLAALVAWELRSRAPMLDVRLFRDRRFSAASASVTVAFFALFGFIFLITQYFQFVLNYSPLEAGARLAPFAVATAIASVAGARLAATRGPKLVVAAGLAAMATGLLWTGSVDASTGYLEIAVQMVVLGGGLGLTSAPSTASIMDVLPPAKAGVGSAVNDTTRQVGGTLGVAVIGSAFSTIYADRIVHGPAADALPAGTMETAKQSLGAALSVAARLPGADSARFALHAQNAFLDGLTLACYLAGGAALAGAIAALVFLPGRRWEPAAHPEQPADTNPALGFGVADV
jgi:EmrB/QacA subfamily drug resistance transporter